MALLGFGIFLYVETDIMSLPAEGVAQALAIRTKRPMSTTKIFLTGPSLQFLRSYQSAFEGIQGNSGGNTDRRVWRRVVHQTVYTLFSKPLQRFLGKEVRGGQPEPEISQPD